MRQPCCPSLPFWIIPSVAPPLRRQVGSVLCFTPWLPSGWILPAIHVRIRKSPLHKGVPCPRKALVSYLPLKSCVIVFTASPLSEKNLNYLLTSLFSLSAQ